MDVVQVAVIGYGHLGKWHCQKAQGCKQSNLYAIVEPSETNQALAKKNHPSAKVVGDIEEVINEIDAAFIITPTSFHFEIVEYLIKKNKHIFCEKPLCSTPEQAQKIINLSHKKIIQVGHSERCHQAWETLKPKIQKISGQKLIKINRYAPFKGRATDVDVVQDLMIHDIDLLHYLFESKVVKVSATGFKVRTNNWDHVSANFIFENGDEAVITSGRNHVKEVRSLEIMSSSGCDYVDLFSNEIHHATDEVFKDGSYVETQKYEKRDHLLLEHEAFYQSILNNAPVFVSLSEGAQAVNVAAKVIESLETKSTVELY